MKKIVLILITSMICVCIGTAVAYYNTAALGYDNANLLSVYDGGFYLLDFDINYEKTKEKIEEIEKLLPPKFITI